MVLPNTPIVNKVLATFYFTVYSGIGCMASLGLFTGLKNNFFPDKVTEEKNIETKNK